MSELYHKDIFVLIRSGQQSHIVIASRIEWVSFLHHSFPSCVQPVREGRESHIDIGISVKDVGRAVFFFFYFFFFNIRITVTVKTKPLGFIFSHTFY